MKIFDSRSSKIKKSILLIVPVIIIFFIGALFYFSIDKAAGETVLKEQQVLEKTLKSDAINYYAINGQYPNNLDTLIKTYSITYDTSKFVIDYTPNGANLLPSISVIISSNRRDGES